jgi:hypothetical protein
VQLALQLAVQLPAQMAVQLAVQLAVRSCGEFMRSKSPGGIAVLRGEFSEDSDIPLFLATPTKPINSNSLFSIFVLT